MMPTRKGSLRLFRVAGIDLYLHWSWFLVAAYEMTSRAEGYSSLVWNGLEYLSLFSIVMLHEFGHALACRQVGGQADQIVLWPLGGVAYVAPPQRPGATLWSIAAGPLVNVVLFAVLLGAVVLAEFAGWPRLMPNACGFLNAIFVMNGVMLAFNLLPIYPLDGGQILRSLLWFWLGRARSLMAATIVGFAGAAVLSGLVVWMYAHSSPNAMWFGVMVVFILLNCWRGFQQARLLVRLARLPRHTGLACPSCQAAPPIGPFWACGRCRIRFDTFATQATCPQCLTQFPVTVCLDCGAARPFSEWVVPPPLLPRA